MSTSSNIRFGGFILNRARGCLEDSAGAERFLQPKSYRLLEVLLDRRGRLVSKDDLVREVWPDVFVSDDWRARGVSVGLASHGIGTARAFQVNPTAGAYPDIAMALNALLTSLIVPVLVRWLI